MPVRGNKAQVRMWRLELEFYEPLFTPADTAWSTTSSTPVIIDWTFIKIGDLMKGAEYIQLDDIREWHISAQLAVSAGTGYLELYNYTKGTSITQLTTTATVKSNRVVKKFTIPRENLDVSDTFVLRAWNDPGGTGYGTYVGKVGLRVHHIA